MITLTLFCFILGLFFGSFILVVADRSGRNVSFITGRSICESCKHALSWYELIPLFSFLLQAGRCRHCKAKLSWWYPMSEFVTGLVLALVFVFTISFGLPLVILYELISLCLLAICFADMKYEIIPFSVVIVAIIATAVLLSLSAFSNYPQHILSAGGAGFFFLTIFLVTKGRGMGFGDVMYSIFMGLLLGFPGILLGLYLSFIVGALLSLVLIVLKKKKLRGGTIPFGPFLVLGTFIMMIWGQAIIRLAAAYFG